MNAVDWITAEHVCFVVSVSASLDCFSFFTWSHTALAQSRQGSSSHSSYIARACVFSLWVLFLISSTPPFTSFPSSSSLWSPCCSYCQTTSKSTMWWTNTLRTSAEDLGTLAENEPPTDWRVASCTQTQKGESPDSNGIRTEDIRACDDETKEMLTQIFNEITKQNEFTPEAWKKVKIKVLHKKSDVEHVGTSRPICSLPALYKLFSTILYRRLYPRLDQEQAEDQAGFRSSYQTTDHLATYRMIEQKCHEWGIKMWIATIDFTKAFDSITHKSIWKALKSCGINHEYISLLKKIYIDQKASVQTDVESNMFEIKKGTKQGDPLSSLLLNTVFQSSLKEVTQRWQKEKGMGIYLSDNDHDCLTNLRFADDVLLFATSKDQPQKCCTNSKKVLKKCVSGSTQERQKFSTTEAAFARTRKKKFKSTIFKLKSWQEMKAWVSSQSSLSDISQIQAGTDIEKLLAQTPSPTDRRSNNSDDMLCIGNMCTKEHERMIQSAQSKMLRLIIKTRRYKHIVKHKVKTRYLPHFLPVVLLDPLAPCVVLHRIRGFQRPEFREFVRAKACVSFPYVLLQSIWRTAHCQFNRV